MLQRSPSFLLLFLLQVSPCWSPTDLCPYVLLEIQFCCHMSLLTRSSYSDGNHDLLSWCLLDPSVNQEKYIFSHEYCLRHFRLNKIPLIMVCSIIRFSCLITCYWTMESESPSSLSHRIETAFIKYLSTVPIITLVTYYLFLCVLSSTFLQKMH